MIHRDYIMRMIQQMARFLAGALNKLKTGQAFEVHEDLKTVSPQLLGIPFDLLLGISNQDLVDTFHISGKYGAEKCFIAARLLYCEGLARESENPGSGTDCFLRALDLLLAGYRQLAEDLQEEAVTAIDETLQALSDRALPVEFYRHLAAYYEERGDYATAEDCIFTLAEHNAPGTLEVGEAFYDRMQERSDEELEAGKFSREEIEEGREELKDSMKNGQ